MIFVHYYYDKKVFIYNYMNYIYSGNIRAACFSRKKQGIVPYKIISSSAS
jgi:hypothetical protein